MEYYIGSFELPKVKVLRAWSWAKERGDYTYLLRGDGYGIRVSPSGEVQERVDDITWRTVESLRTI